MGDWQPIETVPKDGTEILLTNARVQDWTHVAYWDDERDSLWAWARADASTFWHRDMFTHWMPLPEPPNQSDPNGAASRIEALEALLEAPTKEEIALYARIEALEAALREIAGVTAWTHADVAAVSMQAIARVVLAPEQGK
jgi:ADP-ribosylglycohydrolase